MFDFVNELFLNEYFLIEALLGNFLKDSQKLFFALGKNFFLTKSEINKLYPAVNCETVKEIRTENDFMRYRRIKSYSRIVGIELNADVQTDEIINLKGNAIAKLKQLKLKQETDFSRNFLFEALSAQTNAGCVDALRITGFLRCEGILFEKNVAAGISALSKSADWNDAASLTALMRYDKNALDYNLSRLCALAYNSSFTPLYIKVSEKFKRESVAECKLVRLLENAFEGGVLNRGVYDRKYARIIYGQALDYKCKENALFNTNGDLLSAFAELPLNLSSAKISLPKSALNVAPLQREKEIEFILRNFADFDSVSRGAYRPLCISSDSRFLLNMYAKTISSALKNFHIEKIEVSDLSVYDFEPTVNNVFVRSVNEEKSNCLMIFVNGCTDENVTDAVKSFLKSGNRVKFRLGRPNAVIDLSPVLPVCFCSSDNAKYFRTYCDVLHLAEVSKTELPEAVDYIISKKKKLYGVSDITVAPDAFGILQNYSIDTVETALGDAVRECANKRGKHILNAEKLVGYTREYTKNTIGFGGTKNEIA